MLLIEGSDCLGKTTLAKTIVRRLSEKGFLAIYSWMTRPNEEIFDFFLDYKKLLNPYAVQDRFHLGGLAYHKNKIWPQRLSIINSWIRSVGGIIVVLYANDEQKYKSLIENDTRGNLLDVQTMCDGNNFFKNYANKGDCDFAFNVLPINFENPNYVNDSNINEIIDEWISRRFTLERGDII
jgi:hypothetical protein